MRSHPILPICGALVLVLALAAGWNMRSDEGSSVGSRHGRTPEDPPNPRGANVEPRRVQLVDKSRRERREVELADLMDRYRRSAPVSDPQVHTEERLALIREAVSTLLCSVELVDFGEMLKKMRLPDCESLIEQSVTALLLTDQAPEVRESLIDLQDHLRFPGKDDLAVYNFKSWIEAWFAAAGRECPEDEIDAFHAAVESDDLQTAIRFAYNVRLSNTRPHDAVVSTLEEYTARGHPGDTTFDLCLFNQIHKLPSSSDFAELEKQMPAAPDQGPWTGGRLTDARRALFTRWAQFHPAQAARHIAAHPGRLPADYLNAVVRGYCQKDIHGATEWVQRFPEGPYYDVAVSSLFPELLQIYPERVWEIAGKLQDPELREGWLEYLRQRGKSVPASRTVH